MHMELNQKLAEWVGFKRLPKGNKAFHYEGGDRVMNWMPPGETDWFMSVAVVPHFTDSMDSCFHWLMPKLKEMELFVKYTIMFDMPPHRVSHYWAFQERMSLVGTGEDANSPALAFCLAVEQLIDNKGSN